MNTAGERLRQGGIFQGQMVRKLVYVFLRRADIFGKALDYASAVETEVVLSVFAEITALTVPVGIGGNPIARLKIPYIFTYLRDDPEASCPRGTG